MLPSWPAQDAVPYRNAVLAMLVAALMIVCLHVQARPAHPTVTRLKFRPGQNRIVVTGSLSQKGTNTREYSLAAKAGQRLKIALQDLKPRGSKPFDTLVSMYHITFPSGKKYGMKGYDPFDGRLTETGLYHITVDVNLMASNRTQGKYRLTLTR